MKDNNYLRIKIYVFILIFAYSLGAIASDHETIMIYNGREIYKTVFKHSTCGLTLVFGFGTTLIYDIYIYFKSKK